MEEAFGWTPGTAANLTYRQFREWNERLDERNSYISEINSGHRSGRSSVGSIQQSSPDEQVSRAKERLKKKFPGRTSFGLKEIIEEQRNGG